MKNLFTALVCEDHGQDLIEYAILTGFIALVCIAAITAVGSSVSTVFDKLDSKLRAGAGS